MKTPSPRVKKTKDGGAPESAREVFIVRLWRHARNQPDWLGQVQHVRTGQIAYIRGTRALFAYFRRQIESGAARSSRGLK